jgi:hypothetical protein
MIKLAQYSLVELIQDSGTTCIYMGERTTDGAQVTVKLCKAEYPSARDVLRLRHEYGILKELGEQGLQGIPRAYALENHGAGLALVMERLPGRPLHQVMQSGALGLSRVLHIGSAIAAILEALHRQRIIHKDIKPPDERIDPSTAVNVPQDTASQAWRRGRKPWRASRAPLAGCGKTTARPEFGSGRAHSQDAAPRARTRTRAARYVLPQPAGPAGYRRPPQPERRRAARYVFAPG